MKNFIKPIVIGAAFVICAVMYSCSNKSDMELSLAEYASDETVTGSEADQSEESSESSNATLDSETQENEGQEDLPEASAMGMSGTAAAEKTIFVHVCGAVKNPDVYELKWDSRVFEAIKSAGGFTDEADDDYLNLAGGIADGQKIYIPTLQEVADGMVPAEEIGIDPVSGTAVQAAGEDASGQTSSAGISSEGKININTATVEQLKTLNGIGDKRAQDIIDYRDSNGEFKSIEDIKKVNGIKDGIYVKIKDDISV